MNKNIEQLRIDISQIITDSNLPVGIVYYVLKDMVNEIGYLYERTVQSEASKTEESKE